MTTEAAPDPVKLAFLRWIVQRDPLDQPEDFVQQAFEAGWKAAWDKMKSRLHAAFTGQVDLS